MEYLHRKKMFDEIAVYIKECPNETSFIKYIEWLNDNIGEKNEEYLKKYLPIIKKQRNKLRENTPFLSVVMRTQGRRPEMLREALLSLVGQIDQSFEVLLIGHKLNEEQEILVREIIEEFDNLLESKISFIKLDYGTRTTPLNIGFSYATGKYIAILDDDDVVYSNWVEEFHKAAEKYAGQILHAFVVTQDWITIQTKRGYSALRANRAPINLYCTPFDFMNQINENYCPPVGLAFPAYMFQQLGIIFDESLSTREDWDFLMRTAFFAGVHNIEKTTALYRLWSNAENSHTVHNQEVWDASYRDIQNKFKNMPLLIPAHSFEMKSSNDTTEPDIPYQLFYCGTEGFSEEKSITIYGNKGKFNLAFHLHGKIEKNLRFDPGNKSNLLLAIEKIEIYYTDGCKDIIDDKTIQANGDILGEYKLFFTDDPQLIFSVKEKAIDFVKVEGAYNILDYVPHTTKNTISKRKRWFFK